MNFWETVLMFMMFGVFGAGMVALAGFCFAIFWRRYMKKRFSHDNW